jgi:hypothetical protein
MGKFRTRERRLYTEQELGLRQSVAIRTHLYWFSLTMFDLQVPRWANAGHLGPSALHSASGLPNYREL